MKPILIFIFVFVLMLTYPCFALASEVSYPSVDDYRVILDHSDDIYFTLFDENYVKVVDRYISNGQSVDLTSNFGSIAKVSAQYYFTSDLAPYFSLLTSATKVWFKFDLEFYEYLQPLPNRTSMTLSCNYDLGSGFNKESLLDAAEVTNGENVFNTSPYSFDVSNPFMYSSDLKYLTIQQSIDVYTSDGLYTYQFIPRGFALTIYMQGISGTDANLVLAINGGFSDINKSINELTSEVKAMQGQLDNIQSDINTGFNEVGGKLDSMLTPDSNNQQAVDQMGGQVNNNKQEAEDIKNQINSLDKPDPDDLIDQIDPDQFIDNDDEAVQEMTGILASVTGSKVVKNYLLLLICVGIVSFVVYGKKGG